MNAATESAGTTAPQERWDRDAAWAWHRAQPWRVGFNYLPRTAVNTTAFWQAESFDAETIAQELGWAGALGFNACRVSVQYLVWDADPEGFAKRFVTFLDLADRNGLAVAVCLFDDCAFSGKQPYLGPQEAPRPGIHNSAWTPSPGHARVVDRKAWPKLAAYVADVVGRFAKDKRVFLWDLYNEPGNGGMGEQSRPLLEAAFAWARDAGPQQPITSGIWEARPGINTFLLKQADIITFHNYAPLAGLRSQVRGLEAQGRPLLCTEWMARTLGSTFDTHLPYFRDEGIGCLHWGLVQGAAQTHYPWGSEPGAPEPAVWFHDILRPDGAPYDAEEIALIQRFSKGSSWTG